ncbi:MAG: hypothetical protein WC412_08935, partial [Candidatus Omnitrophota bacterium]|jgi:hypothetical protein
VEGFEGRNLKLIDRGLFRTTLPSIDGNVVKPKMFYRFSLTDNNGQQVEAKLVNDHLIDLVNIFEIKGQRIHVREPLTWYQYAWSAWPLLLLLIGGAIGGALGGAVTVINVQLFRIRAHSFWRYLVTLLISLLAVVLWFTIRIAIYHRLGLR